MFRRNADLGCSLHKVVKCPFFSENEDYVNAVRIKAKTPIPPGNNEGFSIGAVKYLFACPFFPQPRLYKLERSSKSMPLRETFKSKIRESPENR